MCVYIIKKCAYVYIYVCESCLDKYISVAFGPPEQKFLAPPLPACAQTASYPRNATEDGKLSHSGGDVKLSGDGQAFFWSPTKK